MLIYVYVALSNIAAFTSEINCINLMTDEETGEEEGVKAETKVPLVKNSLPDKLNNNKSGSFSFSFSFAQHFAEHKSRMDRKLSTTSKFTQLRRITIL